MQLESIESVFVLQIELFESNQKILKKLTETSNIKGDTLGGRKYQVSCAIFHHGALMDTGHYTCMVKKKRWMQINDEKVSKQK